jgi:hypothetical protein
MGRNGKFSEKNWIKNKRKIFDEMMSYPRLYNVAGIAACKPWD